MNQPLPLSLFELLRADLGESIQVLRCSKATLVQISHTIEDAILQHRVPALLFTGFQESSHWREETARYRALADVAQQVCIFAGESLPPESAANQLHVTLEGDDPLRQEWFLAILSSRLTLVLCGQDRKIASESEATREFDTLWSFQPEIVERVLDRLEEVLVRYRPDRLELLRDARASMPLQQLDPLLITQIAGELVRYQERLQRSLSIASQRLSSEIRLRADLIETLVHDMRTPLQSISQTIDFVRHTPDLDDATRNEMLDLGLLGAAGLDRLIQTILDTNRLESGVMRVDLSPIVPAKLLEQALDPLRSIIDLAGIRYEVSIAPGVLLLVCDGQMIGRVLQNLVGNAVRFTERHGLIRIEMEPAGQERICIRVRDSGSGIEADRLSRIFERYYRDGRDTRSGSGIGLYFSRLAVEAHGGTIRADSQIGIGTIMTIILPVKPPAIVRSATGS